MTAKPKKSSLYAFLEYRGARNEHFGLKDNSLTYTADVFVLGILGLMIYRNLFVDPHKLVWLLLTAFCAHAALLITKPRNLGHWRVVLIAINAMLIAMAVPLKLGGNVMVTSYIATLGCLALFFSMGTVWALSAAATYTAFVAVMLQDPAFGFGNSGYNIMMTLGIVVVILTALLMLHHFMGRLERANLELVRAGDYLQQSVDGLHYAAAAGSVGIWSYKPSEERWNSNEIFRDIIDLPTAEFETLTTALIKERLPENVAEELVERMRRPEDAEFEMVDVLKHDGTRLTCQIMSKVYPEEGGSFMRRGVLVAVNKDHADLLQMLD